MIRVLLADDQPVIRVGFRTILDLEEDIEVVAEAADGFEAVELTARLRPDLVCMDVRMPRMDGIEASRRIVADSTNPGPRILVLTTFDRDDFLFETLRAGASGFVLKTIDADGLIRAIRTIAAGDALLAPQVTRRVIDAFTGRPGTHDADPAAAGRASRPAVLALLTQREQETLRLLARGLSNGEIAQELHVGAATVKTYVSNVLMKIGVRDRTHAVIWAYENGVARGGIG